MFDGYYGISFSSDVTDIRYTVLFLSIYKDVRFMYLEFVMEFGRWPLGPVSARVVMLHT